MLWTSPIGPRLPSASEVAAAAPALARLIGVTGKARLTCAVMDDGGLRECKVAAEGPAGWSFGSSAVDLAESYRTVPPVAQGNGGRQNVTVRMAFAAGDLPAFEPHTPGTARARALARRVLDASNVAFPNDESRKKLKLIVDISAYMTDPAIVSDVRAALEVAYIKANDQIMEDLADILASQHSEALLAEAATFQYSPAGTALRARVTADDPKLDAALERLCALIGLDAREAFCANHECAVQPTPVSPAPSTRKP